MAHTMSVVTQLPPDMGGASGKVAMQLPMLLFLVDDIRLHTSTQKAPFAPTVSDQLQNDSVSTGIWR